MATSFYERRSDTMHRASLLAPVSIGTAASGGEQRKSWKDHSSDQGTVIVKSGTVWNRCQVKKGNQTERIDRDRSPER